MWLSLSSCISQLSHSESADAQRQPASGLPAARLGKGRARRRGAVSGFVPSSEAFSSFSLAVTSLVLSPRDATGTSAAAGQHLSCLRLSCASQESVNGPGRRGRGFGRSWHNPESGGLRADRWQMPNSETSAALLHERRARGTRGGCGGRGLNESTQTAHEPVVA